MLTGTSNKEEIENMLTGTSNKEEIEIC